VDLRPRERLLRVVQAYTAKRHRHFRDQGIARLGLPRRHDPDRERQVWQRKPRATDARAADFNVVHFSLQHDHIHLLVEATDAYTLSCGMRRLIIRLANRINAVVRRSRKGKVWGDRYHRHDLTGPTEVRNALVYVLQNGRKHGVVAPGDLDRLSSATDHVVWADFHVEPRAHGLAPRTWLLGVGWSERGGGLLLTSETPRT
jgi:putative transposase